MINDPGNHWHKDDMPFEDEVPGVTDPNYDETNGHTERGDVEPYNPEDVPF